MAPGTPAGDIAAFARRHGAALDALPWCGPVRLSADHPAGTPPLVHAARLSSAPGLCARPDVGAHLAVVAGPDAGAVWSLADSVVVGRSGDATLRVADRAMSARHLRVARGRVRDLGSANGTRLGGALAHWSRRVRPGDVLTAGESVLQVRPVPDADNDTTASRANPAATRARMGAVAGAGGAVSLIAMALASGNWALAAVALVLPAAAALGSLRRRREGPQPLLDPCGTSAPSLAALGPVAVVGDRGVLRAVTLACGRPAPSVSYWEPWMAWLPHPAPHPVTWVTPRGDRDSAEAVPSWARTVVRAAPDHLEVTAEGATASGPVTRVSERVAEASARRLAARAAAHDLPASVRWGDLAAPPPGATAVRLGSGAGGTVWLDLVADGPHFLVAGTTGSGKSEALRTLVASLAYDYSPAQVSFALIDFKGGAGLGSLAGLPHVRSTLTDLEPHLARRALEALAAELTDRKRALARTGGSAYDDWTGERPPRLVVVVDEFQEIAAGYRDFAPELARLAAQGRSLGIHLILATQRPAGAVSAEIRANVSTTLALRTATADESRDLIGSGAAGEISRDQPGRALLLRGGALERVQVALATAASTAPVWIIGEAEPAAASLAGAARERYRDAAAGTLPPLAPLWLPELPSSLPAVEPSGRLVLGLADLPRERLRALVEWDPAGGPLVIVGPPRSGRTTALGAVCAQARGAGMVPVWLPPDPRLAVRTLALVVDVPHALLAVDDAEVALARAATADPEAAELLALAAQRCALALVAPATWASHRLVAGSTTVVLTGLGAADSASWGVPGELRGLAARPGRAMVSDREGWREAQLALAGPGTVAPLALPLPRAVSERLPARALGIGGDDASVVELRTGEPVAVVGPAGAERDAVAARVARATGIAPPVAESVFSLPGARGPATTVIVRPTARAVREVLRDAPPGLIEPQPVPMRVVLVRDGVAQAVQVSA